jgi:hypothetical protein
MAWMALRVCSYELYEADGLLPGDAGDGGDDMASKHRAEATKTQGKREAREWGLRGERVLRKKGGQRRRQGRPGESRQAHRQKEQGQQGKRWKQHTKEGRRAHQFGKRQKGGASNQAATKTQQSGWLVGSLACNGNFE